MDRGHPVRLSAKREPFSVWTRLVTIKACMPNKATQLVQLLRSTKRDKCLGTVILFVTSRCNSFCRTCFYHEELNRPGDMTFAQIEKVSRTMPPITDLWLSGGEPTLRHDASQIIDTFVR